MLPAEVARKGRDPARVSLAYTEDSRWRDRSEFLAGRGAIVAFLTRKWANEHDYRLIKRLWAFTEHRVAVRFADERHDGAGCWFRAYRNENLAFTAPGLMRLRLASINDVPIEEADRLFLWPLGRRPDEHVGLTEIGL